MLESWPRSLRTTFIMVFNGFMLCVCVSVFFVFAAQDLFFELVCVSDMLLWGPKFAALGLCAFKMFCFSFFCWSPAFAEGC